MAHRNRSRSWLENASRGQLKQYLGNLGIETYAAESIAELREAALYYSEQFEPDESSGLGLYDGAP